MYAVIKDHVIWFQKKIKADSVDLYATQSAFFIIISLIPFILFCLSLFNYININGETFISYLINLLPTEIRDTVSNILVGEGQTFGMISITAITTLWSASRAMFALIKGLNSVFDIDDTRSYVRVRVASFIYTFAFVVVIVAAVVILLFGNIILDLLTNNFPQLFNIVSVIFDSSSFWSFIILAFYFTLSYKLVPRKNKIRLINCFFGACLSSLGWLAFSSGFSYALENFLDYSKVYGNFAAVVVVMLWLYICMYIMLFGGIFACWLTEFSKDKKVFVKETMQ